MIPNTGPFGARLAWPGSRMLRVATLFAGLALFVGACGGSDNNNSSNTAPTGATGPQGNTGPSALVTRGPGVTGATNPGDVVLVPGALTELNSFRFEIVIQGAGDLIGGGIAPGDASGAEKISLRGAWIKPDKAQVEFDLGGFAIKQTVIGNQEWTSFAGINTGPLPATSTAADLVVVADFLDSNDVIGQADFRCAGLENINGVQAVRCEANEEAYESFIREFTEDGVNSVDDAKLTMWVATEGGYVVRSELTASGRSANGERFNMQMTANITDVGRVNQITP